MANRCPSCNKFVGIEAAEPEVNSVEVEADGEAVRADVRLALVCLECGEELSEYNFEIEAEIDEVSTHAQAHDEAGVEYTLDVEDNGAEAFDRYQTQDRHGKPIKNMRYQRHFYGVNVDVKVTCSCGQEFDAQLTGEEQASAFDQLY